MSHIHKSNLARGTALTVLVGTLLGAGMPAHAQTRDAATAEPQAADSGDIVVTAQKREQRLQDIGIAITAVGKDSLNQIQKADVTQLAKVVPSLQVQQWSPTITLFDIRGVAQNDVGDSQEAPIAFYNDEVYIASTGAVTGQMFDVERVEVLRGPQGTLFGRNATGGLVHVITAKPSKSWQGFATLTGGSYGQFGSEIGVGGPLSERVRTRLSFTSDRFDGYSRNQVGPDQNNKRFYAGRAQLEFDVGSGGLLRLKAELLRDVNSRGTGFAHRSAGADADCRGVPSAADGIGGEACYPYLPLLPNYGYVPSSDPFKQSYNRNSHFDRTYWNTLVHYEQDLGFATLTSLTSYQNLRKAYTEDTDASAYTIIFNETRQRLTQLSEELRLAGKTGRLDWTTGLYAMKIRSNNPIFFNIPVPTYEYDGDISFKSRTNSFAVFAQGEYKLNDIFKLIVGGRYTWDRKRYDLAVRTTQDDGTGQIIPYDYFLNEDVSPSAARKSYKNYSAKVELDAKLNEDTLLYASINRGTKAGDLNLPYVARPGTTPPQDSLAYNQEVLTNFEAGFKLALFDRKVTVNGSVFHYRYKDFQAYAYNLGNAPITNQPARVTGVELEVAARPTRNVNIGFFLSHLPEATAKDVRLGSGRITDTRMPQAPKWSLGGSLGYTADLDASTQAKLSTNWKYNSSQYFTTLNAPIEREPGYVEGSVRASLLFDDGRWEAAVNVYNVTNKRYRVFTADDSFLGFAISSYGRPRWVSGSITYRFGQ